jgi:hypothetical protein
MSIRRQSQAREKGWCKGSHHLDTREELFTPTGSGVDDDDGSDIDIPVVCIPSHAKGILISSKSTPLNGSLVFQQVSLASL